MKRAILFASYMVIVLYTVLALAAINIGAIPL